MTFEIAPMTKVSVAVHLTKILKLENIEYQNDDLAYIVNTYYPDIRKIINVAQQSTHDCKLKINKDASLKTDTHQKLIDMIKNGIGKPVTFNEIRQFVADQKIKVYDDYFSILYQKVDEYANGKQAIATIIIAEYMYQCSLLIPPLKEIALMACISKLLTDLRK
jgi:DNA polymerase III delta prime subunit